MIVPSNLIGVKLTTLLPTTTFSPVIAHDPQRVNRNLICTPSLILSLTNSVHAGADLFKVSTLIFISSSTLASVMLTLGRDGPRSNLILFAFVDRIKVIKVPSKSGRGIFVS
mmetsp:Transcript_128184/g.251109  ORF Transcript_128184/g.251109 Transcript_128184/m.251109 type:complete len:112 (+) Transcript_128184:53-388(+)